MNREGIWIDKPKFKSLYPEEVVLGSLVVGKRKEEVVLGSLVVEEEVAGRVMIKDHKI